MSNPIMYKTTRIMKETCRGTDLFLLEDALFDKRIIFFNASVDSDSCNELLKQLMYLNQENETEEITIFINSPGGEVQSGLAVYDYMRMMKAPLKTICSGLAASMGSIFFLAGDKRIMLPHTKVMIHDPSFNQAGPIGEKPMELQKRLNDILKIRETLCQIIAGRTHKTLEEIYEKTQNDYFFDAQEALDFGIATEIADYVKKGVFA